MSDSFQHDRRAAQPAFDAPEGEQHDELFIGDEPLAFDESLYSQPLTPRGVERETQPLVLLLLIGLALTLRVTLRDCTSSSVDEAFHRDIVCEAEPGTPLRAGPCDGATGHPPGGNRARMALGMALCWSSVTQAELTTVRGIGEVSAARIVEYRDGGGEATVRGLRSVSGIGPVAAHRVFERIDPGCEPRE